MPLSARDLADIEKTHKAGLSSKQILEILAHHGQHLTEATLRKYVQLGLLPRSRRVGEKGKHRGSRGIYPVEVIRRIDEIRRAMTEGETLESLARANHAVKGRLSAARALLQDVLDAALADLEVRALDRSTKARIKSEIAWFDKQARTWIRGMESVADKMNRADNAKSAAPRRTRRLGGV